MLNDSPCNESASRPITSSFLRRISSPAPPCPQPSKSMNFLASPQPRHTNNNRSTLKKPSDRSSAPVLNRLSSIFSSSLRRPSCRRMNNSAATPTKSVSTRPTEEFKPCILATFPSPAARSRQHLASRPRPHSQFDISSTTDTLRKRRHTDVHVTLMRQISESSESSSVSSTKTLHNSSTSGNCSSGSSSDESEKETDEETSVATEEDLGDDDFVKGAELGAGLAGPTPAKSCSTIYPSLETRIHDLPHTQRPQSPANESRLIRAGHDRPFSPREKNLFRHRTVFGKTDHAKKENKTVSIWRASVEKLLQQSPHNAPALLGPEHGTAKDIALAKFIVIELYTTEQSYHRLLKMVQTNYMQVMAEAAQPRNPLFRAGDVPILFQHLPDLIALSEKLLTAFEYHASQLWRMFCPAQVGPIFRNLEDDLVVFLRYAMHYQNNIKSIRRACNNVLVLKIEQETLSQKDTHRLGIADYLIAPFQRVPRYCLLIKDLLKHTERCDPNYKDLDIALKLLTGLVTAMDYVQETHRIKSTF